MTLLLLTLAAGCAGLSDRTKSQGPSSAVSSQTAETTSDRVPAVESSTRPDIELTEDILYKLLVAEIAGQRGQLDIAVDNYLDLAEETRDPEIASRATRIAVYARNDEAASRAARICASLTPTR